MRHAVEITGVGAVGPYGTGLAALEAGLRSGEPAFEPESTQVESRGFDAAASLGAKGLRTLDRVTRLTLVAAQEALASVEGRPDAPEVGVVLGTAFSNLQSIMTFFEERLVEGANAVSASGFGNTVMNAPASQVSLRFGVSRLNATLTTGSASGLDAIGYALRLVRSGRARMLLAGGADEVSAGALAHRQARRNNPETAPLPLGEAAAFVVLEPEGSQRRPLARVTGYGSCFDPAAALGRGMSPEALGRAMRQALRDAELSPEAISWVALSATGSPADVQAERLAIEGVFGRPMPCWAPKRLLGDTMGAHGALAVAAVAAILQAGEHPEGGAPGGRVLVNAFGDSGHCASLVLEGAR